MENTLLPLKRLHIFATIFAVVLMLFGVCGVAHAADAQILLLSYFSASFFPPNGCVEQESFSPFAAVTPKWLFYLINPIPLDLWKIYPDCGEVQVFQSLLVVVVALCVGQYGLMVLIRAASKYFDFEEADYARMRKKMRVSLRMAVTCLNCTAVGCFVYFGVLWNAIPESIGPICAMMFSLALFMTFAYIMIVIRGIPKGNYFDSYATVDAYIRASAAQFHSSSSSARRGVDSLPAGCSLLFSRFVDTSSNSKPCSPKFVAFLLRSVLRVIVWLTPKGTWRGVGEAAAARSLFDAAADTRHPVQTSLVPLVRAAVCGLVMGATRQGGSHSSLNTGNILLAVFHAAYCIWIFVFTPFRRRMQNALTFSFALSAMLLHILAFVHHTATFDDIDAVSVRDWVLADTSSLSAPSTTTFFFVFSAVVFCVDLLVQVVMVAAATCESLLERWLLEPQQQQLTKDMMHERTQALLLCPEEPIGAPPSDPAADWRPPLLTLFETEMRDSEGNVFMVEGGTAWNR